MGDLAAVGVIGGSGFYEFFDSCDQYEIDTPFGRPSGPLVIGEMSGKRVAFLPRHGRDHRFPPHKIPYQANVWAMRSVGVRQVLAPSAVGSLTPEYGPGTLAVPDQLVDRTFSRAQTFYSQNSAVHVAFADPYCPAGRQTALSAARSVGWEPVPVGTLVVIEGPRFSTRAESRWYAAQGWTLIGMTALPEAALARELALCYTTIALVTDTDAGVEEGDGVTQADVFAIFGANIGRLREVVAKTVEQLALDRACPCSHALDSIKLPFDLPG